MHPSPDDPRPFESLSELQRAHEELLLRLEEATGEAPGAEVAAVHALASAVGELLTRGVATGVYLGEGTDRGAAQSLLDYWVSLARSSGVNVPLARLLPFDAARLPELPDTACPYVGLEAFREARFFFGREEETARLVERIVHTPLVVVHGASGSGKSSLLLAGALPRLLAEDPPRLRVVGPFVPGDDPVGRLAGALAHQLPGLPGDLAARLRADPSSLGPLVAGSPPLLVVIDQFEEVFTLVEAPAERAAIDGALAALLRADAAHRVALTVREEFHPRLVGLAGLAGPLASPDADFGMRPMGFADLCRAVERPAELVNLRFERGIVADLVNAVLGQPAALPLLQFALRQLWNARDRNRITREAYAAVGSPVDALARAADTIYAKLLPQTRAEVRRVLLELVRVDDLLEAYRQPKRRSRLLEAGVAETPAVLRLLVEADFVHQRPTAEAGDPAFEVKHEALLRNWPAFAGWIEEKRRTRRRHLALSDAARAWEEAGRPADRLLRGWQLEEARAWPDLSPAEKGYVDASFAEEDAARREREAALVREATETAERERAERQRAEQVAARIRRSYGWLLFVSIVSVATIGSGAWMAIREAKAKADAAEALITAQVDQAKAVNEAAQKVEAELESERAARFACEARTAVDDAQATAEDAPLRPVAAPTPPPTTIYLHISSEAQREDALVIEHELEKVGVEVPKIQKVEPVSTSQVRFFHEEDRELATRMAELVERFLAVDTITPALIAGYPNLPPGRLEIWFASDALGPMTTPIRILPRTPLE